MRHLGFDTPRGPITALMTAILLASFGCADATKDATADGAGTGSAGKADKMGQRRDTTSQNGETGISVSGSTEVSGELTLKGSPAKSIQRLFDRADEAVPSTNLRDAYSDVLSCDADTCQISGVRSIERPLRHSGERLVLSDGPETGGLYYIYKMMLVLDDSDESSKSFESLECTYRDTSGATTCKLRESTEAKGKASVAVTSESDAGFSVQLEGKASRQLDELIGTATRKHGRDVDVNLRETYSDSISCDRNCKLMGVKTVSYSLDSADAFTLKGVGIEADGQNGVYLLSKLVYSATGGDGQITQGSYGSFACNFAEHSKTTTCKYSDR